MAAEMPVLTKERFAIPTMLESGKATDPAIRNTMLLEAVERNDLDKVKFWVECGAEINFATAIDFSSIDKGKPFGFINIQLMLGAGFEKIYTRTTPLITAIFHGYSDIVRYLLVTDSGALSYSNELCLKLFKFSLLELALFRGYYNQKVVDSLLEHGLTYPNKGKEFPTLGELKLKQLEDDGLEQLLEVFGCGFRNFNMFYYASALGEFSIVEFLCDIKRLLNIELVCEVICFAARRGNRVVVELFLKKAAAILQSFEVKDSQSPKLADILFMGAFFAAAYGQVEILRLLADKYEVDLKIKYGLNMTLLHVAAFFDQVKVLQYLIDEKHLNINQSSDFDTPVCLATGRGNISIVDFFIERDAVLIKRDAVLIKRDEFLTDVGSDIFGINPFTVALINSRLSMMQCCLKKYDLKYLLSQKFLYPYQDYMEILVMAAQYGSTEAVELLLQHREGVMKLGMAEKFKRLYNSSEIKPEPCDTDLKKTIMRLLTAALVSGHLTTFCQLLQSKEIKFDISFLYDTNLLAQVACSYSIAGTRFLLNLGFKIDRQDAYGNDVLMQVVKKVLYDLHEAIDGEKFASAFGMAPQVEVVRRKQKLVDELPMIKFLLSKDADPTKPNHKGESALSIASERNKKIAKVINDFISARDKESKKIADEVRKEAELQRCRDVVASGSDDTVIAYIKETLQDVIANDSDTNKVFGKRIRDLENAKELTKVAKDIAWLTIYQDWSLTLNPDALIIPKDLRQKILQSAQQVRDQEIKVERNESLKTTISRITQNIVESNVAAKASFAALSEKVSDLKGVLLELKEVVDKFTAAPELTDLLANLEKAINELNVKIDQYNVKLHELEDHIAKLSATTINTTNIDMELDSREKLFVAMRKDLDEVESLQRAANKLNDENAQKIISGIDSLKKNIKLDLENSITKKTNELSELSERYESIVKKQEELDGLLQFANCIIAASEGYDAVEINLQLAELIKIRSAAHEFNSKLIGYISSIFPKQKNKYEELIYCVQNCAKDEISDLNLCAVKLNELTKHADLMLDQANKAEDILRSKYDELNAICDTARITLRKIEKAKRKVASAVKVEPTVKTDELIDPNGSLNAAINALDAVLDLIAEVDGQTALLSLNFIILNILADLEDFKNHTTDFVKIYGEGIYYVLEHARIIFAHLDIAKDENLLVFCSYLRQAVVDLLANNIKGFCHNIWLLRITDLYENEFNKLNTQRGIFTFTTGEQKTLRQSLYFGKFIAEKDIIRDDNFSTYCGELLDLLIAMQQANDVFLQIPIDDESYYVAKAKFVGSLLEFYKYYHCLVNVELRQLYENNPDEVYNDLLKLAHEKVVKAIERDPKFKFFGKFSDLIYKIRHVRDICAHESMLYSDLDREIGDISKMLNGLPKTYDMPAAAAMPDKKTGLKKKVDVPAKTAAPAAEIAAVAAKQWGGRKAKDQGRADPAIVKVALPPKSRP